MKKYIVLLFILMFSVSLFSQEKKEEKESAKFGWRIDGKLGFGTLKQTDMVDLNGWVNSGEFSFFYDFKNNISLSLGAENLEFKANGVFLGENYALDQSYLKIPLKASFKVGVLEDATNNKLNAYVGLGVYANTLLKEKIQLLEENFKNKNQGWNAGMSVQLGITFDLNQDMVVGIGFETQNDFTKMKKNDIKRKMKGISTFNFRFQFNIF